MKVGNLEVYGVIYKITNKVNGKVYIGQTTRANGFNGRYCCEGRGIERVRRYHEKKKEDNTSYNEYLLNSIKKYGEESFDVNEIFDFAFSQDELDVKEEVYIKLYKSTDRKYGYNFTYGGEGGLHSIDAKSKNGVRIVCLNDNMQFKSMQEASKYYGISTSYIKNTLSKRFYSDYRNYKYIRFKKIDRELKEGERLCACCGVIMKMKLVSDHKSLLIPKRYVGKYCAKCSDRKYRENKDKNKKKDWNMKLFYEYKEQKHIRNQYKK